MQFVLEISLTLSFHPKTIHQLFRQLIPFTISRFMWDTLLCLWIFPLFDVWPVHNNVHPTSIHASTQLFFLPTRHADGEKSRIFNGCTRLSGHRNGTRPYNRPDQTLSKVLCENCQRQMHIFTVGLLRKESIINLMTIPMILQ